MDVRHFVIIECSHPVNGCIIKCSCIGFISFLNLSCQHCQGTMICDINTIGIVLGIYMLCDALFTNGATVH